MMQATLGRFVCLLLLSAGRAGASSDPSELSAAHHDDVIDLVQAQLEKKDTWTAPPGDTTFSTLVQFESGADFDLTAYKALMAEAWGIDKDNLVAERSPYKVGVKYSFSPAVTETQVMSAVKLLVDSQHTTPVGLGDGLVVKQEGTEAALRAEFAVTAEVEDEAAIPNKKAKMKEIKHFEYAFEMLGIQAKVELLDENHLEMSVTNRIRGVSGIRPTDTQLDSLSKALKATVSIVSVARDECDDKPGWRSPGGATCQTYKEEKLCTRSGGHGVGWPAGDSSMSSWADSSGVTGFDACCECGGGNRRLPA
jgi:hypothetical protein